MRPRRPHYSGFAPTCVFLASAACAAFASAQTQYGDSAWTGQAAPSGQAAHSGQLGHDSPGVPRQHPTPQARQPQASGLGSSATTAPQRMAHPGYANSPSQLPHQGSSAPGYPSQSNSAVIPAAAEGPARETALDENSNVPTGRPVSTGKDLTPINGAERDSAADKSSGGVVQTIVSVGSSLLIVGGLFFGLVWVYRKTANTTLGGGLPKGVVNVLGRTPIAARQQMLLVRFGHKLVLVSVVQGDARTISEITDPLEVDRLTGLCESAKPDSSVQSFRSFLAEGSKA